MLRALAAGLKPVVGHDRSNFLTSKFHRTNCVPFPLGGCASICTIPVSASFTETRIFGAGCVNFFKISGPTARSSPRNVNRFSSAQSPSATQCRCVVHLLTSNQNIPDDAPMIITSDKHTAANSPARTAQATSDILLPFFLSRYSSYPLSRYAGRGLG